MSECTHDCSTCGSACSERTAPQSLLEKPNELSKIKKVIGVIRGSDDSAAGSKKQGPPIRNQNVEITYSDRERYNR